MTTFKHFNNFIFILLSFTSLSLSFTSLNALAADVDKTYQATTTTNANVDLGELEFSLTPLTKAELSIEVDAWLVILKARATIVSEAEILVSQKQRKIRAAEEISDISADSIILLNKSKTDKAAAEELKEDLAEIKSLAQNLQHKKADQAVNEVTKTSESLDQLAKKADIYSDKLQERREHLIKNLTQLRADKNDALERFLVSAYKLGN